MPRTELDRDKFVARIERRQRLARFAFQARQILFFSKRPKQQAIYEATSRSDAEAVTYHYALRNDHLPDLEQPVWLNEKIRWQFLNHPNPLLSYASDKIAVRNYLRFKDAQIDPPRLIATGSKPRELAVAELPETFVLKSSFGSGQMHIELGQNTPRKDLVAQVERWMERDRWRQTGELHYRDIRKRWLVEEYISANEMTEYKIFCMMGEPVLIQVIAERNVGGQPGSEGIRRAYYDLNWRRVSLRVHLGHEEQRDLPRPPDLELLIDEARRLSRDFMHVRVDFLCCDGRFVFSELTFASMAARVPFLPLSFNERFGEMMKLEHAQEYLELGRSVIEILSEQENSRALPTTRSKDKPLGGFTLDSLLSRLDPDASVELKRDPPRTYGSVGL